jgi:hypothetical protein
MIYHFVNSKKLTVHGLRSKVRQQTASIIGDGLGDAGRAHCCKIANCEYHCDCTTVERVRDKEVYCLARPRLSIICMPKKDDRNVTTVWILFCCAASGMTWLRRRGHHRTLQSTYCWCSMARRISLICRVSAMSRGRTMSVLAWLKTLTWKLMVPLLNLRFSSMGDNLRFLYSRYCQCWKSVVSQELIQNFK